MTTRQELLTQWQQRLADAEQAWAAAPSWSGRVQLKLYRFLLAMYSHTPWPGSRDDVDNSAGRAANSELIVAEPQEALAGKEPRTRAEILKGLRNLKGLSDELAPPGPLADGVLPSMPYLFVAAERPAIPVRPSARIADAKHRSNPDIGLTTFLISICALMTIFFTFKVFDGWLVIYELPSDLAHTAESIRYCAICAMISLLAFGVACVMHWRKLRSLAALEKR